MEGLLPATPLVFILIGFAAGSAGVLFLSQLFKEVVEALDELLSKKNGTPAAEFSEKKPASAFGPKEQQKNLSVPAPPPPKPVPLQQTRGFRTLFESFQGGAATLDDTGCITDTNQSLGERLGYSADELKGQPLVNFVHAEDKGWILSFLKSIHDGTPGKEKEVPSLSKELRCFDKAGAEIWVHLALSVLPPSGIGNPENDHPRTSSLSVNGGILPPILKPAFEPLVVLAMLTDVTRRRQAENSAARLAAGVHDMYKVMADRSLNLAQQMHASLSLGCHLFDVRTGVLAKTSGERLEIAAVVSPDERLRVGRVYDLTKGAPIQRPVLPGPLTHAAVEDWRDYPVAMQNERETFLSAPIFVAGKTYGVLYFSDANPRPVPFDTEQVQFCQLMALWIGSEIERHLRRAQEEKRGAELAKAHTELQAIATVDALTGVKNRRAFDELLQIEWAKSVREGRDFSVLLMDVDKFKQYNDSFGHPAGDEVLKHVGRILRASVRDGVFVGRYGGEEFVALMPATGSTDALAIAERLRAAIESATWQHREITASFGVATTAPGIKTPADLVSAADSALYTSKQEGRNRVTCWQAATTAA